MVEFTSEPQKRSRPVTLYIALGILALMLGGAALLFYYHRGAQSPPGAPQVTVQGLLAPGNTDFEYYKTRIRIENALANLRVNFSNARTATITGIIVNDGDRTLEALELHITLYDIDGKVIKERTAFALRPGTGFNWKPMAPFEKRTFEIPMGSVGNNWNPKQISPDITGLKYQ
jgi:hypothetical protein